MKFNIFKRNKQMNDDLVVASQPNMKAGGWVRAIDYYKDIKADCYYEIERVYKDHINDFRFKIKNINNAVFGISPQRYFSPYFDCDNALEYNPDDTVTLKVGDKLQPLPKPKFDFEEYLIANGFNKAYSSIFNGSKINNSLLWFNLNSPFLNNMIKIERTKENADILIEMNKLASQLK